MPDQEPVSQPARLSAPVEMESKILESMRSNPKGDWKIGDIETVCRQFGIIFKPPSKGSHYKVRSPRLLGMLTIPAHRPIKIPYIRSFVALVDAHCQQVSASGEGK